MTRYLPTFEEEARAEALAERRGEDLADEAHIAQPVMSDAEFFGIDPFGGAA